LVDYDQDTKRQTVLSVITQYRLLKFVAVNVRETELLRKPLKLVRIGTWNRPELKLQTARVETPCINIIHQMVKHNISCIPIVNSDGKC
jgi:5'-AMP-activated protein kinase regulatory gamma subunit